MTAVLAEAPSMHARQIAVLPAAAELLARVGTAARLALTINPRDRACLNAQVVSRTYSFDEQVKETEKLAGIVAAGRALGACPVVEMEDDTTLWLVIEVTILDVPVQVWTVFYDPEVITAARYVVAPPPVVGL